jgi:RNA polymerase sigma-70 factor, ECF subfamily
VDIRETDWVGRIRAGDESAFEAMFRTYSDRLCAFAVQYLGTMDTAEEVVEDVFLAIWQGRARWRITTSLKSYLYTATRNRSLNVLKRRTIERRHFDQMGADPLPRAAGPADAQSLARDLQAAANRAIAGLPDRCREAFLLLRQHELSYAEIAAIMDITPKTVENQVGRALAILKEKLAAYL